MASSLLIHNFILRILYFVTFILCDVVYTLMLFILCDVYTYNFQREDDQELRDWANRTWMATDIVSEEFSEDFEADPTSCCQAGCCC